MDQQQLLGLCRDLNSEDQQKVMDAATMVVNTTPDLEYRNKYMLLVTNYQTAKDSIEMNKAFEELIQYTKSQFVSIYAQGFALGASYKDHVFQEMLNDAVKNSQEEGSDNGTHSETEE
jgi:hypothetical protein